VYDFMACVGKIVPSGAGQPGKRGSVSGRQTMSGMKDFSRQRTVHRQSRELCRDPPRWAGPSPYEKVGVTGTAAAVNTYQILRSHKRIVGKPEAKDRLVNVIVDGG
jgi:hypothetical protein